MLFSVGGNSLSVQKSSRSQMLFKINYLKNFAMVTEERLCWSLFSTKFQVWKPVTLLKRDSSPSDFLWILHNFLKQLFLYNICEGYFCNYPISNWRLTSTSFVNMSASIKSAISTINASFLANWPLIITKSVSRRVIKHSLAWTKIKQ